MTKNNNVVSLAAARKKKHDKDTQSATLKPDTDLDDFFAGLIEKNRKAAKAHEEARKKRNQVTKRRYQMPEDKK